jgi:triphosphatase
MPLFDLAQARIDQQVAALSAHEAGVRSGDDPEDVHQMRVATRRLRAALRLFQPVLPPTAPDLRRELAWIADILGEARDLDVQIDSLARAAGDLQAEPEAFRPVLCLFQARQSAARERLRSALSTERFATLVVELRALVAQPPRDVADDGLALADQLVRETHRKLRKAGEQLHPSASPTAMHRARIRAKRFRYALECLAPLYGRPAQRLIRRAARLQDVLGSAQDAAVLRELLHVNSQPEHDLPPPSVFLLGQLSEMYAERVREARAAAPPAYHRLVGRPWKRLKRRARRCHTGMP